MQPGSSPRSPKPKQNRLFRDGHVLAPHAGHELFTRGNARQMRHETAVGKMSRFRRIFLNKAAARQPLASCDVQLIY